MSEHFLGSSVLDQLGIDSYEQIRIENPWYRGGAETYVTDFIIHDAEGKSTHLIAKACIKFSPREAMAEWLDRRRLMESNGVNFPKLFAVDGATIVEEYIPHTFKEAYLLSEEESRQELRSGYIDAYKRICGAGFNPASLHDVRSRGNDVVVIDVGEDIGGHMPISSCDLSIILRAESSFRDLTN